MQAAGWYYPDSLGGTEVYVATLAHHLRAAGHQVLVAAPEPGAAGPRTYEIEETQVFRYPIPLNASRDEAQGDTVVRGAEHLHRWLNDVHADVVHFHTFVTGLGIAEVAAAKQAGSRVVATTHSSSLGFLCQRGTLMWRGREMCDGIVDPRRCAECELEHRGAGAVAAHALASVPAAIARLARRLPGPAGTAMAMVDLIERNRSRQRAMLDAVDAFVVLTQRAADIVIANGAPARKVTVNRLGIRDIAAPAVPCRNARPRVRIGYVGRFDPIKGVLDLAEAARRLSRDLPVSIEFRGPAQTPGDTETRAAIARLVAGDPRVTIGDPFPPASVANVLGTYDVLCLPSRCLEGGPTVGLEAMAAGVPVIAAASSGVAEVIEDGVNGKLVPPGNVDRLAAAITDVASRPEQTIDRWRLRLPQPRSMRDVARDYLDLYGRSV